MQSCISERAVQATWGIRSTVFMHKSRTRHSDIPIRRSGAFNLVQKGVFSTVLNNNPSSFWDISPRGIIYFVVLIYPLTNPAWFLKTASRWFIFFLFTCTIKQFHEYIVVYGDNRKQHYFPLCASHCDQRIFLVGNNKLHINDIIGKWYLPIGIIY